MKVKKVDIPIVPTLMEEFCETPFNSSNTTDYHTDSGSNASDRHSYYTNSSAPLPGMSPTPSRAGSFYDGATVASFPDDGKFVLKNKDVSKIRVYTTTVVLNWH